MILSKRLKLQITIALVYNICCTASAGVKNANAITVRTHIEECENTLSGLGDCQGKVVISVSMKNNAVLLTDKYIKLDTANHWKLKDVKFFNPLILRLNLQKVFQVYPLQFVSVANNHPYEEVIHKDNHPNFSGCSEDFNSTATCGLVYEHGQALEGSQGYCCPCNSTSGLSRGGQKCSNKSDLPKREDSHLASAHCLRFDSLWYSVFNLRPPSVQHKVTVSSFQESQLESGDVLWQSLHGKHPVDMGTEKAEYQSDDNQFYILYKETPSDPKEVFDYQKKRLLVPKLDKFESASEAESPECMVIDKKHFTDSGRECNKIGVSYQAFINEPDRCLKSQLSCLGNQPFHFWLEDKLNTITNNRSGKYWLSNIVPASHEILPSKDGGEDKILAIEFKEHYDINIQVEIAADNMTFLQKGLRGQILDIVSFPESANSTAVRVNVYNNDLVSNVYNVVLVMCVHACDVEVFNSNQTGHIPPHLSQAFMFYLNFSGDCNETIECKVTLHNQRQKLLAERTVALSLQDRCACMSHCKCKCQSEGFECDLLSSDLLAKAGIFVKAPPWLQHLKTYAKHPNFLMIASLCVVAFLLVLGAFKAVLGLTCSSTMGKLGLGLFCRHPEKQAFNRQNNAIHSARKTTDGPMSRSREACLNFVFFFYLPFMVFHWLYTRNRRQTGQVSYTVIKSSYHGSGDHSVASKHGAGTCNLALSDDEDEGVARNTTQNACIRGDENITSSSHRRQKTTLRSSSTRETDDFIESMPTGDSIVSQALMQTAKHQDNAKSLKYVSAESTSEHRAAVVTGRTQVRKHVAMLITKRYPVYCNYTEEHPYVKDSGNCFSLCGQIKKTGKSHQFTIKSNSKQVRSMRGGVPCALDPPLAMESEHFRKNLTAEKVANTITLNPTYKCLNEST